MNKILIITRGSSDLSDLILANCPGAAICDPFGSVPVEEYDALCILSGNEDRPMILPAALRLRVEAAMNAGKPVFTEFLASVGSTYLGIDIPATMTHHRAVYAQGGLDCAGLTTGDVLDGHHNSCCQNSKLLYHLLHHSNNPFFRHFLHENDYMNFSIKAYYNAFLTE